MMKTLMESPPRTIMEVYKSLPEGTLAELIDNNLYMSPSPLASHQKTLQRIFRKLSEEIEDTGRGEIYIAPFDVYLDEDQNAVQPDIIVVLKANEGIIDRKGHIHGVPDLLIEILSPGNKDHDQIRKKELYERFGVKEYWMVDPETKTVTGYSLQSGKYAWLSEETGKINSRLLGVELIF
jgi:Uma2 family endonuclease